MLSACNQTSLEFKFQLFTEQIEDGGVRMISPGNGNMILVGTTKNSILTGSLELELSVEVQVGEDYPILTLSPLQTSLVQSKTMNGRVQ